MEGADDALSQDVTRVLVISTSVQRESIYFGYNISDQHYVQFELTLVAMTMVHAKQPWRRKTLQKGWMFQVGRWGVQLLHWTRRRKAMPGARMRQKCTVIYQILRQARRGEEVPAPWLREGRPRKDFVLCCGELILLVLYITMTF